MESDPFVLHSEWHENSSSLDPARVKELLRERVDHVSAKIIAHYEREGFGERALQVTTAFLKSYEHNHLLSAKSGRTVGELMGTTPMFYALEVVRAMTNEIPRLSRLKERAAEEARSVAAVVDAWMRASPQSVVDGRAPALRAQPADPAAELSADAAELGHSGHRADDDRSAGYFSLWRDEAQSGFFLAMYGRGVDAVRRFAPAVQALADSDLDDINEVEAAYFEHYRREVERATYPFGVADDANRRSVTFALTLTMEAESAGSFRPRVRQICSDRSYGCTPVDVVSTWTEVVQSISGAASPGSTGHQPIGAFDLIRVAAAVQLELCEDNMSPHEAVDSGWHKDLHRMGFAIPRSLPTRKSGGPEKESQPRVPFARELARLIPYSPEIAEILDGLWPAGSRDALARASENRELAVTNGKVRDDAIIAEIRSMILTQFYRERIKNEQLDRSPVELSLVQVNKALNSMLVNKINTAYREANKRPREESLEQLVESSERDVDETGDIRSLSRSGASVPRFAHDEALALAYSVGKAIVQVDGAMAAPASRRSANPAPRVPAVEEHPDWIYDFSQKFPQHWRLWKHYVTTHDKMSVVHARNMAWVEAFSVWAIEQTRTREQAIRTAHDEAKNRPNPTHASAEQHDLFLSDSELNFAPTFSSGVALWVSTLPEDDRVSAARSVRFEIKRMYTSPMWEQLDGDVNAPPRSDVPQPPRRTRSILAADPLVNLFPASLLKDLLTTIDEGPAGV